MCQQEESYSSLVEIQLLLWLLFCKPQWWEKIECDVEHECESRMICIFQIPACQRTFWVEVTPKFFIDDWSLIGEPATEMDVMDFAMASSGLDLGLKKAMASDLLGLRWRPLFRSQSLTLWVQDFNQSDLMCQWGRICTDIKLSVISILVKWNKVIVIELARVMTFAIGDMKRTKRRGPRTEPWGTPVSVVVQGEDGRVNFNEGWTISQVWANPSDDIAG